ncbi:MAG: DUF421 domain-containing protein, partial [Oscillospiraceae bacterium]|nr:DUF421 domain-containing protein [Oscillospiraceae bacterium]
QAKEEVLREDMKIPSKQQIFMPTSLIFDGYMIIKNLKELNLSEKWLNDSLKDLGIQNQKDVLYAELQADGQLYVQSR